MDLMVKFEIVFHIYIPYIYLSYLQNCLKKYFEDKYYN